jgi:hypothetical protein
MGDPLPYHYSTYVLSLSRGQSGESGAPKGAFLLAAMGGFCARTGNSGCKSGVLAAILLHTVLILLHKKGFLQKEYKKDFVQ